jgi:hypothetical protein
MLLCFRKLSYSKLKKKTQKASILLKRCFKFTNGCFFLYILNRMWITKVDEICSIELIGHKFFAPCNPYEYIRFQYGKGWSTPHENQGIVSSVHVGEWSDKEWPHFIKDYRKNGTLNVNSTIALLNEWYPYKNNYTNITELPDYELLYVHNKF